MGPCPSSRGTTGRRQDLTAQDYRCTTCRFDPLVVFLDRHVHELRALPAREMPPVPFWGGRRMRTQNRFKRRPSRAHAPEALQCEA